LAGRWIGVHKKSEERKTRKRKGTGEKQLGYDLASVVRKWGPISTSVRGPGERSIFLK